MSHLLPQTHIFGHVRPKMPFYGEAHYVETCIYPVFFLSGSISIPLLAAAPYSPSHYYRETFLMDRNGIEADVF